MVELPDLPGTPAWDEQAAAELVAVAESATRLLDEQWQLFDRGWWELLTGWTGRTNCRRVLLARSCAL